MKIETLPLRWRGGSAFAGAAINRRFKTAMRLKWLAGLQTMADIEMTTRARRLAAPDAKAGTADELAEVAVDLNRLADGYGHRVQRPGAVEVSWVMSDPDDFIEGKPDLPSKDTDLKTTQIPGAQPGKKYWEYTCVLIALIKRDKSGIVKRLTNTNSKVLKDSVQALHKYDVENDVQYEGHTVRSA